MTKQCLECGGILKEKVEPMYDSRLPHTKQNKTMIDTFSCVDCVKVYSAKDLLDSTPQDLLGEARTLSGSEIGYLDGQMEFNQEHLGIFDTDGIYQRDHKVKTMTYKQYKYILHLIHMNKWFKTKQILSNFFELKYYEDSKVIIK